MMDGLRESTMQNRLACRSFGGGGLEVAGSDEAGDTPE